MPVIALQNDGKILFAATFINNNPITKTIRLNTDGSIDSTFNHGASVNYSDAFGLQLDGKILMRSSYGISRLNIDGSLDTSFNRGTGTNSNVASIALQSDGKILIGGTFTAYNGTVRNSMARLNTDGSLDSSFDSGRGANYEVSLISILSGGKILIAGYFTSFNGIAKNHIARLYTDGSLDTSFNPQTFDNGSGDGVVYSIVEQSEGKILVGGDFISYNNVDAKNICRIYGSDVTSTRENRGSSATFSIHPNPATSQFYISVSQAVKVQVLNAIGQVVITQVVDRDTPVSTATLSPGMYTVLAEGYKATSLIITK